ncbi:hypothetical protein GJ744_002618 [Endocarpon pusillum]|uniref:Uncharacterized protein n=1 Tax=Endocarpon pusillum TaxID=364733 RepID=A0A8H7A9Y9_9EURO|nr:hypothetical protein GJ744_002618 [Endocarpon pusillum]
MQLVILNLIPGEIRECENEKRVFQALSVQLALQPDSSSRLQARRFRAAENGGSLSLLDLVGIGWPSTVAVVRSGEVEGNRWFTSDRRHEERDD